MYKKTYLCAPEMCSGCYGTVNHEFPGESVIKILTFNTALMLFFTLARYRFLTAVLMFPNRIRSFLWHCVRMLNLTNKRNPTKQWNKHTKTKPPTKHTKVTQKLTPNPHNQKYQTKALKKAISTYRWISQRSTFSTTNKFPKFHHSNLWLNVPETAN